MRLRALLDPGMSVRGAGWEEVQVSGLTADSRAVDPGMVFAALPGRRADGRAFVDEAVARGAVAVLADPSLEARELAVPLIVDPEPRRRLACMAARFFGRQPRHIAAVTGTNGKTSVACFTRQLWARLGKPAASLGTLGLEAPGLRDETGLTTPDPVRLHELLARLAGRGIEHLAIEASSHGLDQHRLDGLELCAAAFTNLSRDHFDYHGTPAAYFAAKRRLFADILPPGGVAVLNADQPEYAELAALCRARRIDVLDYGYRGARLRLLEQVPKSDGQRVTLVVDGAQHVVETPLVGGFQAANLLAALGLAMATDGDAATCIASLGRLDGAPGRLQRVATHPSGAPIFVDYAHTPDALEQVLAALRPHTARRLVVVFGCGGDRDPGKRPVMGRIAAEHADRAFVTDDNPRSEDPAAIRAAVLEACPGGIEVAGRREAIAAAIAELGEGDVLVVAGKGHETGQIVGDQRLPFDDAAEVRRALGEQGGAAA